MKKIILLLALLSASTAYAEIYTWTDARGTAHYANNLYDVPKRFLSRALLVDLATGRKRKIPATVLQGAPAATASTPSAPAAPALPATVQPQLPPPPAAAAALPAPMAPSAALPREVRPQRAGRIRRQTVEGEE